MTDVLRPWAFLAPFAVFVVFLLHGLITAPFRINAETERQRDEARAALLSADQRKAMRNTVATQYQDGQQLRVHHITSDDEFDLWKQQLHAWYSTVIVWLRANVSNADAEVFRAPPSWFDAAYRGSYNDEHNAELGGLNARLKVLESIIARLPY